MKRILWASLGVLVFSSAQVHALNCEVSYKARKINKERYIFTEILDPVYKVGTIKGKGSTLSKCKRDALKKLRANKWRITYSSAKKI